MLKCTDWAFKTRVMFLNLEKLKFLLIFLLDTISCPPTHTSKFSLLSTCAIPAASLLFEIKQPTLTVTPASLRSLQQINPVSSTLIQWHCVNPLRRTGLFLFRSVAEHAKTRSVRAEGGSITARRLFLPTWADTLGPCALNCIVGGRQLAAVFSSLLSRLLHTGGVIHCILFAVKHIMKEGKKCCLLRFGFPFP